MPHSQQHRGAHPEDRQLFTLRTSSVLRVACEEAVWLLDHGYTPNSVIDVVGRRHQLHARQRMALQRSMCSTNARQTRKNKQIDIAEIRDAILLIDGFNLIISLEVALSGGVLLRGAGGALRDLAGLRGSYHPVACQLREQFMTRESVIRGQTFVPTRGISQSYLPLARCRC